LAILGQKSLDRLKIQFRSKSKITPPKCLNKTRVNRVIKYLTRVLKTKEPVKRESNLLKRERKTTRLVLSQVEQHTHVSNSKKSAKLQVRITQT
jgi:hypothetical protein